MHPKQKIIVPYTYREDINKLKDEADSALQSILPEIKKELEESGDDPETVKQMQKAVEKQLQKFVQMITGKFSMVEFRVDREFTEKQRVERPEDQALIKYNQAEMILLKEGYERCRARKAAPKVAFTLPTDEHLKMVADNGKQTEVNGLCREVAGNYQKAQK